MKLFTEYRGLRKELYYLFIGKLMTSLGSMVFPMLTLILSRKLGMSASEIALYMFVYMLISMPIRLFGGKLADRFSKKNIIVICDLVSIAGYLYCAAFPITTMNVCIFAASSLFQSIEYPAYETLVADFTTSRDRQRAYSLSYLGGNLGFMLAPTISGLLFENHLNLAFLINGISIGLSTLLIFFLIRDTSREKDDSPESVYEADVADGTSALGWLRGNRIILLFILISAFWDLIYMMQGYLMPLDLGNMFGDSGSLLYGTMTTLNCLIVVTCTAPITRFFSKKDDITRLLYGVLFLLAGFALFVVFLHSRAMCYASMAVFTIGEIFGTLSLSPYLTRRIPASHRGRITSIQSVFCGVFSTLLQMAVGRVYDLTGSGGAWGLVLGFGAVMILLIVILAGKDKAVYPELNRPEPQGGNG